MTLLRAFAIFVLLGMILVLALLVFLDWRGGADITVSRIPEGPIAVSVDGSVATPGVFALPANARLNDAIVAAGGLTSDADLAGLNLAARVGDGEQIVVPSTSRAGLTASPASSGLIDINVASAAELDQLPGIGEVLANRIVAYRQLHGRFTSVDQLIEVDGISRNTVEELRDLVTVGG
jgi:competence protein ComEA